MVETIFAAAKFIVEETPVLWCVVFFFLGMTFELLRNMRTLKKLGDRVRALEVRSSMTYGAPDGDAQREALRNELDMAE